MSGSADKCRICGGAFGPRDHIAREMMYGTRDEFNYAECTECGCLQLRDIPDDLVKYYPKDYYSFGGRTFVRDGQPWRWLKRQRAKYCLFGKNLAGRMLVLAHGVPDYYRYFKRSAISFDMRILDVGCGSGDLLLRLYRDGFTNLTGVDPYAQKEIQQSGVTILRMSLSQIEPAYDLVMLNHSFEHMENPGAVLSEINRILDPRGCLVIRIPIVPSFAWSNYGVNWVQLDAPRHLFIHTKKSLGLLSERAGFRIAEIVYDSTELQFWGSEQYLNNIPLKDRRSYDINPRESLFTKSQIEKYRREAEKLNLRQQGDSACFYLFKDQCKPR